MKTKADIHPIVLHLLYGDIEEMPPAILGKAYSDMTHSMLDDEQQCRIACAATVQAWLKGRLHKGGYMWYKSKHKLRDRIA